MNSIIGLTGGIATGKGVVADYLASKYKYDIYDADIYARDAVQVNSPILNQMVELYGTEILTEGGTLNRALLGKMVFYNSTIKAEVESLIHPYVRNRFESVIRDASRPMVLVIPLLFEAKMTDLVTEIWVVSCTFEQQLSRLMKRNNLSRDDAIARINSQMSLELKCRLGDLVLDNSGTLAELYQQIDDVIKKIC